MDNWREDARNARVIKTGPVVEAIPRRLETGVGDLTRRARAKRIRDVDGKPRVRRQDERAVGELRYPTRRRCHARRRPFIQRKEQRTLYGSGVQWIRELLAVALVWRKSGAAVHMARDEVVARKRRFGKIAAAVRR